MHTAYRGKRKKKIIGFRFAWNGIKAVIINERNFKIQLGCGLLACITGAILGLELLEWTVLILVIGLVLGMEMVNSSIERLLDYLAPDLHPEAGMIKDMAAGAVLIAAVASVAIACLIFIPKLAPYF